MLEMSSTRTYEAHVYRKWPLITAYNCLVSELYGYRDSMGEKKNICIAIGYKINHITKHNTYIPVPQINLAYSCLQTCARRPCKTKAKKLCT